jgi:hypothetical protein
MMTLFIHTWRECEAPNENMQNLVGKGIGAFVGTYNFGPGIGSYNFSDPIRTSESPELAEKERAGHGYVCRFLR